MSRNLLMNMNPLWSVHAGRELDATPLPDGRAPLRLVACMNVWNDVVALKQTLPTWKRHVSHIVAVDGAYAETGHALSTDGTREYLQSLPNVTLIDAAGVSQCEKRTRYCRATKAGDLLFIIDADESVGPGALFTSLPSCDVGWARIISSLYQRPYGQPRFIRWQPNLEYRGRHHWLYCGSNLLCTHQYGGAGFQHRPVNITLNNQRRLGRSAERMSVKFTHQTKQSAAEVRLTPAIPQSLMSDTHTSGREALLILMHAYRDDGLAPSRLHTAINRTTPHSSIFAKVRPGPFGVPDQYLASKHLSKITTALATADVVHFHGAMSLAHRAHANRACVFHHHGSLLRANAQQYANDAKARNALILLSNLELFSWVHDGPAFYLPNTVPVARYAELRRRHQVPFTGANLFRVAHSPSKPERKGTDKFLAACARLKAKGYPIEPVVIHNQTHATALHMKATCHAMFDSFWLGMQCSGIEAGAMGLPVIGGDDTVAKRYREHFGAVPFTFANTEEQLEYALQKLVSDTEWRTAEAQRVTTFIRTVHDESAVALRYLDLLDQHFGWRSNALFKRAKYVSASPNRRLVLR